uniref:Coiled-coil domain containing 57 n=1 Tax=Buteo japonicus TaxID=224669 RepID=A0A8C0C122_9AVES
ILWKEKEGKELHACQFLCQKKMLQDVKKQLQVMHEKFNKLKEDFVYNLRILEERDKELGHYDVTVARLKTSENAKQAEISDLRVQLGKMEQMLVKERRRRCKLHYYYQQRIEDHKLELERFCSSRNSRIDHQHEEYANLKHHMERKIQELEGELACQKQELLAKFDAEMKKRKCEFQKQTIEMGNLALHEELAHAAKEKDAMPASVKEDQVKQFKKLKQQIRELQMRYKNLEIELCRREWSHSACLREKDALIRKFQIQSVCGQEDKLRARLAKFQKDAEWLKQLCLAAESKWILEQSKMQAELDWQQLCENAESNWYQKSEDLTQSLSSAREQVKADVQKTDYSLHEVKTVLSALTVEGEETMQASFNHSILPEGEKQVRQCLISLSKDIPTLEIKKLQEQNANLRAAIAQMRKEMESLDEQMLSSLPLTENRQLGEQGDNSCPRTLNSVKEPWLEVDTQMGLHAPLAGQSAFAWENLLAPAGPTLQSREAVPAGPVAAATSLPAPGPQQRDIRLTTCFFQGPKAKVLEEKMVDLGQELPDVGPGVGLQYGVSCTLQGMRNKLKEAASKISILSQEKQQLIEMGNRLRAELVLKEGKFILRKSAKCLSQYCLSFIGLWHPVSSKGCTVCIASGSLFPRELVKRTQCQLSALKHLQHRLTTQVMICSLKSSDNEQLSQF